MYIKIFICNIVKIWYNSPVNVYIFTERTDRNMKYLWTEDQGAGLHFWQLANRCLFHDELIMERKSIDEGSISNDTGS